MPDLDALLARHQPVLRYDRHEIYFADSAAVWTDCPGNALRRFPETAVIAQPPTLRLSFLGPKAYGDGQAVQHGDLIACPTKDYVMLARHMHGLPGMANRVYGRAATGSEGRVWLQYWFFYFYNDFELLGDAFPFGLHEGDWECAQFRLDDARAVPDLAVYAQHKGAEARWWSDLEKVGERPVVYVARGSHASYFGRGRHWQGHGFDHADGEGPSPELTLELVHDEDPAYAWMRWPGLWGDTKPNPDELITAFDATSPRGPGGHTQWKDPHKLLEAVEGHESYEPGAPGGTEAAGAVREPAAVAAPSPPGAPAITASRTSDGRLKLSYEAHEWPAGLAPRALVVTANPPDDPSPPVARSVAVEGTSGSVVVPVEIDAARRYEIHASIAGQPGPARQRVSGTHVPPLTSDATTTGLAAAGSRA